MEADKVERRLRLGRLRNKRWRKRVRVQRMIDEHLALAPLPLDANAGAAADPAELLPVLVLAGTAPLQPAGDQQGHLPRTAPTAPYPPAFAHLPQAGTHDDVSDTDTDTDATSVSSDASTHLSEVRNGGKQWNTPIKGLFYVVFSFFQSDGMDPREVLQRYIGRLFAIKAQCNVSLAALCLVHELICDMVEDLHALHAAGMLQRGLAQHRRLVLLKIPRVKINVFYRVKEANVWVMKSELGLDAIPHRLKWRTPEHEFVRADAYVDALDLVAYVRSRHASIHGDFLPLTQAPRADFSMDDLPENESGSREFKCMSYTFEGCLKPYPFALFNPLLNRPKVSGQNRVVECVALSA